MRERVRDFAILLTCCVLLTLPNLGAPSLWDIDEGVNAETSREMQSSETWVIPTFNYQLRTAKPVMLYWLQRYSYAAFGVSEWSARFPSVIAGWLSVFLIYELARRMFNRNTGLLAGLILASVAQFTMLAHAATPDATLLAFIILAFLLFWIGHTNQSRAWWVTMAAAQALAFLTKGPVGLVLPAAVALVYFAWNRELRRVLDRRMFLAGLVFVLIAGPWYGLVASETRGEWLKTFFTRENVERFLSAMDKHEGPFGFYIAIILVAFSPWSAFLLPLFWYGIRGSKRPGYSFWGKKIPLGAEEPTILASQEIDTCSPDRTVPTERDSQELKTGELTPSVRANRFLLCWIFVYFGFFSLAATKLPNYILPIYPAMAVLVARYLAGYRDGQLVVPRWMILATIGGLSAVGILPIVAIVVMVLASLVVPGFLLWCFLGLIPLAGAARMFVCLRDGNRDGTVLAPVVAAIAFMSLTVAFPPLAMEPYKAPKELVRMSGVDNPSRDIRLGQFEWPMPSTVYYSGRWVEDVLSPDAVAQWLAIPTPAYIFMSEKTWNERVAAKVTVPSRIVARHHDMFHGQDIVVITNEMSGVTAAIER